MQRTAEFLAKGDQTGVGVNEEGGASREFLVHGEGSAGRWERTDKSSSPPSSKCRVTILRKEGGYTQVSTHV